MNKETQLLAETSYRLGQAESLIACFIRHSSRAANGDSLDELDENMLKYLIKRSEEWLEEVKICQ